MENSLAVFNHRYNLCIDEEISIINFKDHRILLNEHNKLVFKCRHKSKFKLGVTKAPTLDKDKDIDFEWFLLEIITFISVVTSNIWLAGGYIVKEILGTLDINSQLGFFNFWWS